MHRSAAERERMLSVLVVGGGPTGVEFAGELSDFINKDLRRLDNERASEMRHDSLASQYPRNVLSCMSLAFLGT